MNKQKDKKLLLSVVLATRNEEENIGRCLESVKGIADEIIVLDEYSDDRTRDIAKKYGAKVFLEPHHDIFHITKQKAIDKAVGKWILQMDADEVLSKELSEEISKVIKMSDKEILERKVKDGKKARLFQRHEELIEKRDGKLGGNTKEIAAFFIPRRNIFLGKPLIHAGVYPDPAIRLIKKGKARLPGKSVHEIMQVDGRVAWLYSDMYHYDSPTLKRYLWRLNRYTDLISEEIKNLKNKNRFTTFLRYTIFLPIYNFFLLFVRHKGFLDGARGFLWSFFSSLRFPISYFKYLVGRKRIIKLAYMNGPNANLDSSRGVGVHTNSLLRALLKLEEKDFGIVKSLESSNIAHITRFHPFFLSIPLIKPSRKLVLTIHDLIPLRYPKHYPPGLRGKLKLVMNKILVHLYVDKIITISSTSKDDIVRFLKMRPEKVKVIYLGAKEEYKPISNKKLLNGVQKKFNLPEQFAFCYGDINYNKNIPQLVKACEKLKLTLVIAGKAAGEIERMDLEHPENSHLKEVYKTILNNKKVIRLGYVSDEDANSIYNLASLYVQPSLFEGFGLSVVHSFAAGCPVIASNTKALKEIGEDACLFFDLKKEDDLKNKIKLVMDDKKLAQDLISKGFERVKMFTWESAAKETLDVYRSVI